MHNLPAPSLNVEATQRIRVPASLYSDMRQFQFGRYLWPENWWDDPRNGSSGYNSRAVYNLAGTNSIMTVDEVNEQGSCQQMATYQWGFSFFLLFIVLILFLVWITGTHILWLDAFLDSKLINVRRDMGLYRAALYISSVIHTELEEDVDSLTPNRVLHKRIHRDKSRARISLQSTNEALPSNTRMMDFQAWGRAGGYSRWMPRITLVFLLALLVIFASLFFIDQPTKAGLLISVIILILINLLVLGNGKRRVLCSKHSQADGASHHPLDSFDENKHSSSTSATHMSSVTISTHEEDDTAVLGNASQPS